MIFPISLTALKYKKPNARKGITTTISAKVLATVLRYKKPNARKGFFTRQMDNGDGYAKRNCPEVIVRNIAPTTGQFRHWRNRPLLPIPFQFHFISFSKNQQLSVNIPELRV